MPKDEFIEYAKPRDDAEKELVEQFITLLHGGMGLDTLDADELQFTGEALDEGTSEVLSQDEVDNLLRPPSNERYDAQLEQARRDFIRKIKDKELYDILSKILIEMKQDQELRPDWTTDPIKAATLVSEAAGELITQTTNYFIATRQGADQKDLRAEIHKKALLTAALAIRFLWHFKEE
jgi:hypothetical protein